MQDISGADDVGLSFSAAGAGGGADAGGSQTTRSDPGIGVVCSWKIVSRGRTTSILCTHWIDSA